MKKLTATCITMLAMIAAPCFAASTTGLKIGIIDMNQILQKSPLMVSLNDGLLKKFQPRQTELANAQKQLQDDNNALNMNNSTMSADDRTKLQTKIVNEQANVQILSATLQRDVAIAKDEALRTFMSKLNSVITKMAKDGNYDFIEQSSNFAFVNPQFDITQQVLSQVS